MRLREREREASRVTKRERKERILYMCPWRPLMAAEHGHGMAYPSCPDDSEIGFRSRLA
jgi:hypothetical protein